MNKPKLKKLLTILVCLMLIASVCLLAACNKDTDEDNSEKVTYEPSFTNGNFNSVSNTDEGYPYTPEKWTGAPTADVTSGTEGDDDYYAFSIDDITAGVISLEDTAYNDNKSKWGNLNHFGANTADIDDDYTNDKNVLMIYNSKAAYYMYKSASFTATANSYYKITVDVLTEAIAGNDGKGASIYLYDKTTTFGLSEFSSIESNGEWTRYSFYIRTKAASSSLQLWLELGNHSTFYKYLTSGYAFFDNVTFEALANDDDTAYTYSDFVTDTNDLDSHTNRVVDLTLPNSEFDFITNEAKSVSAPAYYFRASNSDTANTSYGRVDLTDYDSTATAIGINTASVANPGYPADITTNGNNIYALYAENSAIGFYTGNNSSSSTSSAITFARGSAYKVSIWVYTKDLTAGKVYLGLTPKKTSLDDGVTQSIATNSGWTQYSFIVLANQNTDSDMYFQFWLGSSDAAASGTAFFDRFSVDKLDLTEKGFDVWQDEILGTGMGIDASDYDDYTYNKSSAVTDNILDNPYFKNGTVNGWSSVDKSADSNIFYTPDVSIVSAANTSGDVSIPYSMVDGATTYSYVMKIAAENPTVFGMKITNNSNLAAYTAYRLSVWVKTADVQSTSGIVLTVYDAAEDEAIATFNSVNTAKLSESEGLNGYRELVCYFYTGFTTEEVYFELTFGSGNQFTSSTLFDGTAYVANASLSVVDYDDFNGASSSGTYEKKYNYTTSASSTSIGNGQFDSYDFAETEGLHGTDSANDGKTDGAFNDKTFGVPAKWDISYNKTLKDADKNIMDGLYAGIVDTANRPNLLSNLNAALIADGILSSNYDFANMMYTLPSSGITEEMFDYIGEDTAIMLASKDLSSSVTGANFASMCYTSSDTLKLSANSYYEINVLVKTLDAARASVYLLTDDKAEANGQQFTNISTTSSAAYNGWVKYSFRVKVGFSDIDAQLALYLGQSDDPTDTKDPGASFGGTVFFDRAVVKTIDEDTFNATAVSSTVSKVALDKDSFATPSSHSSENRSFITPSSSSWKGTNSSETDGNRGIITEGYNYAEYAEGLENVLIGHNSSKSALVIHNTEAGAYSFTSYSGKTFAKAGYYKISVFAKTYDVADNSKAYIKLTVNDYTDDSKYKVGDSNIIYFNTDDGDYTEICFYVKTPAKTDLKTAVKLTLGLGEARADSSNGFVAGYAIFDDVSFVSVDEAAYTAATTDESTNTSAIQYKDIESTKVDPSDDTNNNTDGNKSEFNWIIFTSVAFGAVIVLVVIIYYIKKYLPKRKAKMAATPAEKKAEQNKEEKYDDLSD